MYGIYVSTYIQTIKMALRCITKVNFKASVLLIGKFMRTFIIILFFNFKPNYLEFSFADF